MAALGLCTCMRTVAATLQTVSRSSSRISTSRTFAPALLRSLSTSPRRSFHKVARQSQAELPPTEGQDASKLYRERQATGGPFTWRAAAVFLTTGIGLYVYFQNEKKKLEERKKQETASAKVGRPKVGGPFKLTSQYGKDFTEQDLQGKHSLIYFGFTNCPDICPEELDKMTVVVDRLTAIHGKGSVLPIFITCDPARDSVEAVKAYCNDFHPSLIGLTGSYDDIKRTCKSYRVYFSTPPDAKPTDDYLVDHSIFFYLMDPEGQFLDAFGRTFSADEVTEKVDQYMKEWKQGIRPPRD